MRARVVVLLSALAMSSGCEPAQYPLVLAGGRVMDPESGLDAIRNVGIVDGRIEAIFEGPLEGAEVVWVETGERLDSASFMARREEGGPVIVHVIPEASMDYAIAHPGVMIASDGVPFVNGRGHPRGAGTFARVLGHHVREVGRLSLMEALEKMTLLPARRLEAVVPSMRAKGRVAVGADADLTHFNPATVMDRATYDDPTQPSAGIPHVLVNGRFVVRDGELVEDVMPGQPIRRAPVRVP